MDGKGITRSYETNCFRNTVIHKAGGLMLYYAFGFIISGLLLYFFPLIFLGMGIAGIYPTYKLFLKEAMFRAGEDTIEFFADKMSMVRFVWSGISLLFWPILLLCMVVPGATNNFIDGMAEGFKVSIETNDD